MLTEELIVLTQQPNTTKLSKSLQAESYEASSAYSANKPNKNMYQHNKIK